MDPSTESMDPSTEEKKKKDFLTERCNILREIEEFLMMVLDYFIEMEQKLGVTIDKKNLQSSVKPLIKSLYLLHGLYGYPAETDKLQDPVLRGKMMTPLEFNTKIEDIIYGIARGIADKSETVSGLTEETTKAKLLLRCTVINKKAMRNILLNKIKRRIVTKDGKNKTIQFVDYCGREVEKKNFWEFTFGDETFSPESLPREPAHYFLQLVRDMINTSNGEVLATVGRNFLEMLPADNKLKPKVWAYEIKKQDNFGVSLCVPNFVRPLYLCIKLTQLSNVEKKCELKDVKAIKIQDADKDVVKDPCVSCQKFFGFQSFSLLGNCAEYDVIGNVNRTGLLQTPQWREFRFACKQHFDAFKEMLKNLKKRRSKLSAQKILTGYHESTRNPKKPKVLRYEWNPRSEGGFELKLEDWPY